MFRILLLIAALAALLGGCRKQDTSWDMDIRGPVLRSSLGLENLLPDSLLQVNPDGSVTLVFDETLYRLDLDSLIHLPDTTVADTFQLPSIVPYLDMNPGQIIFSRSEENNFAVPDVELTQALLDAGQCVVTLSSTIPEKTVLTYTLTKATRNGQPFTASLTLPPGSPSAPSTVTVNFDLSGYLLNLRGTNRPYNSYSTHFTIALAPDANPTRVYSSDFIILGSTFTGLVPAFAKGYFGSRSFSVPSESADFSIFRKIRSGTLDIDRINVDLTLRNTVGAEARITLNQFESENSHSGLSVALNHSSIGNPINLNRATHNGFGTINPAVHTIRLDESNSNIDQIVENLPNRFTVGLDMQINPMGNISAHNDFVYRSSTFEAALRMELPLSFIANQLTLVDTLSINAGSTENGHIREGTFTIEADNGFPLRAQLQLYMLDQYGNLGDSVVSQGLLEAAYTNASHIVTAPRRSSVVAKLNASQMESLYRSSRILMKVVFETSSSTTHVQLYDHYRIKLLLTGDFNYHVVIK